MNYKVILDEKTKIEFRKSYGGYRNINSNLAKRFSNSFRESFNLIKNNPFLFQIRYEETQGKLVDDFPYLIHYRIIENTIIIIGFYHSSRDSNLNIFEN